MTDQPSGPATPPPSGAEPGASPSYSDDATPSEELTDAVAEGVSEAVTEAIGPDAPDVPTSTERDPGESPEPLVPPAPGHTAPADLAAPAEPAEPAEAGQSAEPAEPAEAGQSAGPEPESTSVAETSLPPQQPSPPAATTGGERLEWRPVTTGEQIEWQPVSVPDDEPQDVPGDPIADEGDDFDDDAGWDQPTAGATAAMAGNGAAGARRRPPRPRPPGGRPPGAKPSGGRRPPGRPAGARPPRREPLDDDRGDEGERAGGVPSKAKRQVTILSVLTVLVVLIGVVGFVLSRGATRKGSQATATTVTSPRPSGGTTVPAADLITYRDEQTGFSIKYPKSWNRLNAPVADIRTVLLPGLGNANAVSVRVIPITTPANQQNIGNFKAVTDAIVFGDQSNKLVQEQLVTLNGKLTYYYLYTFKDSTTNQEGVHAHYFVFEGHRIFTIVFQALPAEEFTRLAAVYDQVAESFTVEPERVTPAPPTTGAAPPTSTPPTSTG